MTTGKFFLPVFFLLIAHTDNIFAQDNDIGRNELGGGIGVCNYTGDVDRFFNPLHSRPAANIYYRRNLSKVVSLRFGITGGLIHGSETGRHNDPLASTRQISFNSTIFEVGGTFEYNFLDYFYKKKSDKNKFSPYFTGGLAFFNYQSSDNTGASQASGATITIPIGLGFKYKLTTNWNINGECVVRKTFIDDLDLVKNGIIGTRTTGNTTTTDCYYYTGLSLSYTFHKVICPKK